MPKAQKGKKKAAPSRPDPCLLAMPTRGKSSEAVKDTGLGQTSPEPSSEAERPGQNALGQPDKTSNYIVMIKLDGTRNPTITRLLSLPPWLTLDKVHEVLQIVFGWARCHMHQFEINLITEEELAGGWPAPPVMYLQLDPEYMSDDLQDDYKIEIESEYTLADIYEKPEWKNRVSIGYEYDLGDGWMHTFSLLGRATPGTNAQLGAPNDIRVICLDGHGHGAAEDSGGPGGWEAVKEAFKHPRKAESKELVDWYKTQCYNGSRKGLDPHDFDVMDLNDRLEAFQPKPPA
ncbi:hypothetical protein ACLMJK_002636 [Lecanora helva]